MAYVDRPSGLSEFAKYGFSDLSGTVGKLDQLVALVGDSGRSAIAALALCADPDQALKILLAAQMKEFPLDEAVEKQGLNMLIPMMNGEGVTFGAQNESDWKTLIDWMVENKHIEAPLNAREMYRSL